MSPDAKLPVTHSTLSARWAILLAACSTRSDSDKEKRAILRPLLQQEVEWETLVDLADRHGVAPLLYHTLSSLQLPIPSDKLRNLRDNYHRNLHKSLFLSRELIRILEHIEALGLEIMPYKGLALAESVYGDIALRQTGDIDLLIRPQDVSRVSAAVRDLGYTPNATLSPAEQHAYLKSGYELSFDGEAGPNLLEVQWGIQPRFYAVDYDMAGLFQRAVMTNIAGHSAKTPSTEDLILILSLHAAKHVWGRLIWLRDVAQMIAMPALNWQWIEAQARELGVARILAVTLLLACDLLNAEIPAGAQNLIRDAGASALVFQVRGQIMSEAVYDVESSDYFRLMISLRERQSDRLRFLQRLLLTPGPSEWKAVKLPAPLFPLYRAVRLWRLAKRVAQI
jgi:hypothetical protein